MVIDSINSIDIAVSALTFLLLVGAIFYAVDTLVRAVDSIDESKGE